MSKCKWSRELWNIAIGDLGGWEDREAGLREVGVKMIGDQAIRIARAIFAGAPHQEVAAEFGVTVREVQAAVEQARRLAAQKAARARRVPDPIRLLRKVDPPADPIIWEPKSRIARELGLKAVRQKPGGPSVSYLTFLHGA